MADDPLEELSRDEKQALVNLVKNDNGFDLSRRDVLALAGGASLGAVLGGTGYSAMGSAKADASTSDSDGNVGLPNDPVDAWIEGLAGPTGSPIDLGSDIVPDTDASYDLGSASNRFNNAYMSNAEVGSINADIQITGESYTVGPSEDLPSVVANRSESIFDLAGRTYEVSSLWTISRSDIKIQNGTVKLADGANSDFVTVDDTATYIVLEDMTFDFNGANNTGAAASGALWDTNNGPQFTKIKDCDFINNNGRGGLALRIGTQSGRVVDCDIRLGSGSDVILFGNQCVYSGLQIVSNGKVRLSNSDNQLLDSQIESNDIAIALSSGLDGDWLISDNIIEDNRIGLLAETSQSDYHTTNVAENQFQGNTDYAVQVTSGSLSTTSAEFALLDNTYKVNGGDNSGNGVGQIEVNGGDGLTIRPAQMTNNNGFQADIGLHLTSNATDCVIEWHGYDNSDFATAAIVDNGVGTIRLDSHPEQIESPSRSLNTWYQNTTGRDLEVMVIIQNDGGPLNILMSVNSSQNVQQVDRYRNNNSPTDHIASVQATVPRGHYYHVQEFNSGTIMDWREY